MPHVDGDDDGVGYGVFGRSPTGHGVRGLTGVAEPDPDVNGVGVYGSSNGRAGVYGKITRFEGGAGVYGISNNVRSYGVRGSSTFGDGVRGSSDSSRGVWGDSVRYKGVYGSSGSGIGVEGRSNSRDAVVGITFGGSDTEWAAGVAGVNENVGQGAWAGFFTGKVWVSQTIHVANLLSKIDHPIDPANKYLYHSSVESPDMKNLYDGVVALDDKGEAEIELPKWFSAFNKDFRYQLTAIGAPGPNLHIAEEISEANTNHKSHFKIAGGTSGMKVSWQVTGVRNDPYSRANPIQIEEDKSDNERGLYIHPEVYGRAAEKRISLENLRKDEVAPK